MFAPIAVSKQVQGDLEALYPEFADPAEPDEAGEGREARRVLTLGLWWR